MQVLSDFILQNVIFMGLVSSITVLAICIIVGFISRKKNILSDEINFGLSAMLVKVTLPCTIFISLMRPFSRTLLLESLATLFLTAAIYLAGYVVGMALARLMGAAEDEKRVWQFSLIFANVGYMGFPVIHAIYGYEGLIYTTMANATFNILCFSLGVYLFKRDNSDETIKANLKSIAFNPALIATVIGFIFFVTGLRLPGLLQDGVALIASMTVPLSMILIGSILAKNRLLTLVNDTRVLPVIFMRLIGIPIAAFFILRPFIHNNVMLEIIVLLAAMPVAAVTAIFAEQYKGNTILSSKLVAISSILCLITIPLISLVLQ